MKGSLLAKLVLFGMVLFGSAEIAFANAVYSFTTIDVPGASQPNGTIAQGINDNGQIVGEYFRDAAGFAFLYTGGTFTTLNVPRTPFGATAQGINNSGQIVGVLNNQPSSIAAQGFLDTGGTVATIDVPDAQGTLPFGINNIGQISGWFVDANFVARGFLDTGGTFTTINVPGATQGTQAHGMNNSGQIVGYARPHGFLYAGGTFTMVDVPGAPPGNSYPYGINDSGQIVGWFYDENFDPHGFLYAGGTFTTIDVPGADFTEAFGINDSGQITGYFTDGAGYHGFLATPGAAVPEGRSFPILAGCLISLLVMAYRRKCA